MAEGLQQILTQLGIFEVEMKTMNKMIDSVHRTVTGNGDPEQGIVIRQVKIELTLQQLRESVDTAVGAIGQVDRSLVECQKGRDQYRIDGELSQQGSRRWLIRTVLLAVSLTVALVTLVIRATST